LGFGDFSVKCWAILQCKWQFILFFLSVCLPVQCSRISSICWFLHFSSLQTLATSLLSFLFYLLILLIYLQNFSCFLFCLFITIFICIFEFIILLSFFLSFVFRDVVLPLLFNSSLVFIYSVLCFSVCFTCCFCLSFPLSACIFLISVYPLCISLF
jgi:hypothetical protein